MKTQTSFLKNSRGAVILSTLVVISLMVVIMIGVASIEVLQIAKDSARVNEAFRYLNVMEEMSQVVGKARILGKEASTAGVGCPTPSTVRVPAVGAHFLCLPDPDGDGDASVNGIREVCFEHTDYIGKSETFCLNNVAIDADSGEGTPSPAITPTDPAGVTHQDFSDGTAWDPNYHNNENWFPMPSWTFSNEMFTPSCTGTAGMWRGCMKCSAPGVSCIRFEVCPPSEGVGCAKPYIQRIAVY